MEKKLDDEKLKQYDFQDDIRAYKEAIKDIQQELCQPLQQQREAIEQQTAQLAEDQQTMDEYQFHQST